MSILPAYNLSERRFNGSPLSTKRTQIDDYVVVGVEMEVHHKIAFHVSTIRYINQDAIVTEPRIRRIIPKNNATDFLVSFISILQHLHRFTLRRIARIWQAFTF